MKIFAIETSCDETAAAVVEDGVTILSNVVASQVELHAKYGGIVPEVASRQHLSAISPVVQQSLEEANITFADIEAVAVTVGPGLPGSLLVGVNMAKAIALANNLPLVGINHIEGHIYANWLEGHSHAFPLICLVVSGGHTDIVYMEDHGQYSLLGRSRDDAAGEAFDKVARILSLGYPGGPAIDKAAHGGNTNAFQLPRAWLRGTDEFSFSGVKTAVLHLVQQCGGIEALDQQTIVDIAAAFQESVVDVLVTKVLNVAQRYDAKEVLLAGGVAANTSLRNTIRCKASIPLSFPAPTLCTDNAAMIASCGYFCYRSGRRDGWNMDIASSLVLGQ